MLSAFYPSLATGMGSQSTSAVHMLMQILANGGLAGQGVS